MTTAIDIEWESFIQNCNTQHNNISNSTFQFKSNYDNIEEAPVDLPPVPNCSPINISTKTKIGYLNQMIQLKPVFWKVPIIPYNNESEGVVKKQMKFNSTTPEEVVEIEHKLINQRMVLTQILAHIDNPTGRIVYKDTRKISIGICKKDILSNRIKLKSAFYNCFVVLIRIFINNQFKEIHVKVFNTGKIEIPGIQSNEMFDYTVHKLISILQPFIEQTLTHLPNKVETVLINSNFTCNYYINREKLHNILKNKYNINSNYDPCSYPGIQCKYNYIDDKYLSFMIFRTGSVLMVGKCEDNTLNEIYDYLKNIFYTEYENIYTSSELIKKKKSKTKFKTVRLMIK